MNNCSFRWKIYRLSLFFKEYVSIKNEFVEKMVRQRKLFTHCHLEGNKE